MNSIGLQAMAKINLTLDVLGPRPDGYHNIRSIMQSISLADQVYLRKARQGITLDVRPAYSVMHNLLPQPDRNLAWRAAAAFFHYVGSSPGIEIQLEKNIPIAAGLAGGSADAAAVLHGLNRLFDAGVSLSELQKLGATLGADIPFCLMGGTVLAEGIGDRLQPLAVTWPDWSLVLVKPSAPLSTKRMYAGLTKEDFGDGFSAPVLESLQQGREAHPEQFGNTMERAAVNLVPEIRHWMEKLTKAGAVRVMLTGSGPTVFGIFDDQAQAVRFIEGQNTDSFLSLAKFRYSGIVEIAGDRRHLCAD